MDVIIYQEKSPDRRFLGRAKVEIMKEENQKAISGLLMSADGKILMGKQKALPRAAYKGYWVIPGGIQDKGESNEQTLKREVFEETGIDVSKNKGVELVVAGDKEDVVRVEKDGEKILCHIEFFTYRILLPKSSKDYKLSDTEELVSLKWFDSEELKNLKHIKPTKNLFRKIGIPGF